jgi:hypothetical protein
LKKLINARKNETETEEHMKMLNEREIGRLKLNISRIHNELTIIKDRRTSVTVNKSYLSKKDFRTYSFFFQNDIVRANQLINEMKDKTNWDEQALEVWLEKLAQKDEDTLALLQYTKQDEMKIKVREKSSFFLFFIFIIKRN